MSSPPAPDTAPIPSAPTDEAELLPEAGGLTLPVEIISMSAAGGAVGRRIVRAVTGQKVRLPPGSYLVQAILPAPGSGVAASLAELVKLGPGDEQVADLRWTVRQTAGALLEDIRRAMREATPVLVEAAADAVRGIDALAPGARLMVLDTAASALRGLIDGLSDGSSGDAADDTTEDPPAGWLRRKVGALAINAMMTAAPIVGAAGELIAAVPIAGESGALMRLTRRMAAGAKWLEGARTSRSRDVIQRESSALSLPESVAPGSAPIIVGGRSSVRVRVVEGGFVAATDGGGPGNVPVREANPGADADTWSLRVETGRHWIAIDESAGSTMAAVPVDVSGPTQVSVSLKSAAPGPDTAPDARTWPQIRLTFGDATLNAMWAFITAGSFDEARQLASAEADRTSFQPDQAGAGISLRALLGAYVLLRANDLSRLDVMLCRLRTVADRTTDFRVLEAECLARRGQHDSALRTILLPEPTEPPLFLPGVAYAAQRLQLYDRVVAQPSAEDAARRLGLDDDLRRRLRSLTLTMAHVAANADQRQLNLVFSGRSSNDDAKLNVVQNLFAFK